MMMLLRSHRDHPELRLTSKGYKLNHSRQVAQQIRVTFRGLYFGTEDKATGRYAEHGGTTAS